MANTAVAGLLVGGLFLVSCSEAPMPPDGGVQADYEWAIGEGPMGTPMISRLSTSGTYSHRCLIYPVDTATITYECAPGLPDGDDANADAGSVITLEEVMGAVNDPDVQAGFARDTGDVPVVFGFDRRVVDGGVFRVTRKDGREFLVGEPCEGYANVDCVGIPPGISRLVNLLSRLDVQQLATADCDRLHGDGMCYPARHPTVTGTTPAACALAVSSAECHAR